MEVVTSEGWVSSLCGLWGRNKLCRVDRRLCPACKDERVRELSLLHRRYDRAILAGDLSAASLAADEVEGYERVWGLRLLAAPSVAQMRRAIAGTSEGDAYGA